MLYSYKMIVYFLLIVAAVGSEILSAEELAVTIYNDDFALVKDTRSIRFDQGESMLYFTDVSENIQTETVTFKALADSQSVRVYEQNFEKNLITQEGLLRKYLDKQVDIVADFGNEPKRISGVLLAYSPSVILRTDRGIVVANKISAVDLASVPDGFFTLPTLNWKVFSTKAQTQKCELAYRTTGFGWKADYIVTVNEQETKADVGGWVTIDNNSGKKYVNTKLKLIAGDVNVVKNNPPPIYYKAVPMAMAMAPAPAAPSFSEKSFADYHMYTLSKPVTLNESSQKQVEFIPKVYAVPIRKFNQILVSTGGYSQSNLQASSKICFNNTKSAGMGMPLPKGTVRVFKEDEADKSLEFIGEDSIAHTPKDENVTLTIGNAFDVKGELVANNRTAYSMGGYRADMNLTLVNHKDTPAEVEVKLSNYNGDNVAINWSANNAAKLVKISATEYRIVQTLAPDQKVTYLWSENYQI